MKIGVFGTGMVGKAIATKLVTLGHEVMIPGKHQVFVSGNDDDAKAEVTTILKDWFGWQTVMDLGDITTARGTEQYLALWVRMWQALGTTNFNIQINLAE